MSMAGLLGGSLGSSRFAKNTLPANPARCQAKGKTRCRQIDAAFPGGLGYYMTGNILWTVDALFQGTQARNPRPDREKGLGAAARAGRARRRCRRPDEGGGPHPWWLLRAFR